MVDFAESVKGALKGGLCAVLGVDEAAVKLLSKLTGSPIGAYPLAAGLRRQLCSDDPANDPVYTPPFEGGQCNAVYVVSYEGRQNGDLQISGTIAARGPIAGIRGRITETGARVVELNCRGVNLSSDSCISVSDVGPGFKLLGGVGSSGPEPTATITSVSPCGLDNCGDIPPTPVPPAPVPAPPTDITYNIDGDTNITVPLTAIFAPVFLSFDGSLKVPVTVNVDGIDFDGTVTISPEFEVNIKPSINIGGPGDVDDPTGIGEPGPGPEPIDDVEDLESTIVGVLVYSDIDSEARPSGVEFTNGPDLFVPRLASVQFAIKTSNSIGWTPDQDVKNAECYVPCPAPQGAIAVRVSPMPGVQSRFTAVRGIPLTTF